MNACVRWETRISGSPQGEPSLLPSGGSGAFAEVSPLSFQKKGRRGAVKVRREGRAGRWEAGHERPPRWAASRGPRAGVLSPPPSSSTCSHAHCSWTTRALLESLCCFFPGPLSFICHPHCLEFFLILTWLNERLSGHTPPSLRDLPWLK